MKRILTSHVGYDVRASKRAVLQGHEGPPPEVVVVDESGAERLEAEVGPAAPIERWQGGPYAMVDFSRLTSSGRYRLRTSTGILSDPFDVGAHQLASLVGDIVFYFRGQRRTGPVARADAVATFIDGREGTRDVRGGWFDASGDRSKNLSHLNYAQFYNPQQAPLPVWTMLEARERLERSSFPGAEFLGSLLLEEAAWGADGLVRMLDEEGFFYVNVLYDRRQGRSVICDNTYMLHELRPSYRAGLRQGAGMAIAALARAAADGASYDFGPRDYLGAAVRAYDHLEVHGLAYLPDGQENIIDDYTGLLAATELARATEERRYAEAAERRLRSLVSRLAKLEVGQARRVAWLTADGGSRPFFHAADEGLPGIATARYAKVCSASADALSLLAELVQGKRELAELTHNPFGCARQLVVAQGERVARPSFFIPHENETLYWWQGENARLASVAVEVMMAAELLKGRAESVDSEFAQQQVDWILGKNPFDTCMLHGRGRNNREFVADAPNAPGGVYNGITADPEDPANIAFLSTPHANDGSFRWRWSEQWIVHAAWLLLAVALLDRAHEEASAG